MDDATQERILKNPSDQRKLQAEINFRLAELGARKLVGLKGQNEFQILHDLKNYASKLEDQLLESQEKQQKLLHEQQRVFREQQRLTPEKLQKLLEKRQQTDYERRNGPIH